MQRLYRWYANRIRRPAVQRRLNRSVGYKGHGFSLTIFPGVFHPGYFHSTDCMIAYLKGQDVEGLKVLELGCGSGLISMWLQQRVAVVTASDISHTVLDALAFNLKANDIELEAVESDLFNGLRGRSFDRIVINPPYYPKRPRQEAEYAWFCGEDYDYFRRLFSELPHHLQAGCRIWMVLSEYCNLSLIGQLAQQNGLALQKVFSKRKHWEYQHVYEIITPA
jgi:release factor glutamine methyltransferase